MRKLCGAEVAPVTQGGDRGAEDVGDFGDGEQFVLDGRPVRCGVVDDAPVVVSARGCCSRSWPCSCGCLFVVTRSSPEGPDGPLGDHLVAFFIGCSSRPRRIAIGYLLQALEPGLCGQGPGSRCRVVMAGWRGRACPARLGDSADRCSARMCSFFVRVQLF